MSQVVSLTVADEIKALGDALAKLAIDIKAGTPASQVLADVLPMLLPALSGLSSIGADIQLSANQIYLVYSIASALEGK